MVTTMNNEQELRDLNAQINEAENDGNRAWLATVLAPKFAFQRADPARTVDDRDAFLQKVRAADGRRTIRIGSICLYGNRALVQCVVAVGDQQFDNLRLFVRREDGWKLLGWANEPM
jgi:hypothetical protein